MFSILLSVTSFFYFLAIFFFVCRGFSQSYWIIFSLIFLWKPNCMQHALRKRQVLRNNFFSNMLSEIASAIPTPPDLEKQDTKVSSSQNIRTMKMSLFSLQRRQKIVLLILILLLLSVEGMDAIVKLLQKPA